MSTATSRSTSAAMISVIERARGRDLRQPSSRLLAVTLMAVFFVALMGGLAAGASLYRTAAQAQAHATTLHLQSGLITNVIHGNDTAGAVSVGEGPEGPALVLLRRLSSGTYETRIYCYEGHLMQELSAAGRPYDPLGATELLETNAFSFAQDGRLLTITTDAGSFSVALRSAEGSPDELVQDEAPAALESILDEGGM